MKRFLVIGLGRFGRAVAEGLTEAGAEVIGVDENMALVEAVRDRIRVAAQVDGVAPEALKAAGADEVDVAVVAMGEKFQDEVLTVAILKEMGIKEIVARAPDERERKILELVGATRVLSLEKEAGERLAKALAATAVVEHVKIAEGYSLIHWTADERAVGKTLDQAALWSRHELSVVAVKRPLPGKEESVTVKPLDDFLVQGGDILVLVGAEGHLKAFTK